MAAEGSTNRGVPSLLGLLGVAVIITGTQPGFDFLGVELAPSAVDLAGAGDRRSIPLAIRVVSPHGFDSYWGHLTVEIDAIPAVADSGQDSDHPSEYGETYQLLVILEDQCGGRVQERIWSSSTQGTPRSSRQLDAVFRLAVAEGAPDCEAEGWTCHWVGETCELGATLTFELEEGSAASADWSARASVQITAGCFGDPWDGAEIELESLD